MAAAKQEARTHPREPSFVSLLSGWAQQGVQSLFATQRILLDLAVKQNASVMQALRQHLTDPHHSPTAILSEIAGEGVSNFIEAQKVMFNLAQKQNEILMTGVKERVGNWPAAEALTDLMRRGVDTFIHMQEQFLDLAGKEAHTWVQATKAGKPFDGTHLVEAAREGMDNFIKAQKQFLDVIADETAKATGGKRPHGPTKKIKKTELTELARQATETFIDAQRKLFDLAGQQMNANVKAAEKTAELIRPFPFVPLAQLTREGVKSYVDAQKALMDAMLKNREGHKQTMRHPKRPVRGHKKEAAAAAVA
jgi:hypothetical protein